MTRQETAVPSPITEGETNLERRTDGDSCGGETEDQIVNAATLLSEDPSLGDLSIGTLFRSYWPAVHRLAERYSRNDAEDLAQVTLFEATRKWGQFDQAFRGRSRGQFWKFVRHILRNNFIDFMKSRLTINGRGRARTASLNRERVQDDPVWEVVDDAKSTPSSVASRRERLLAAIDKLPPSQREVTRLQFVEELPVAATAARLGLSDVEVQAQLLKALRNLKKHLPHG